MSNRTLIVTVQAGDLETVIDRLEGFCVGVKVELPQPAQKSTAQNFVRSIRRAQKQPRKRYTSQHFSESRSADLINSMHERPGSWTKQDVRDRFPDMGERAIQYLLAKMCQGRKIKRIATGTYVLADDTNTHIRRTNNAIILDTLQTDPRRIWSLQEIAEKSGFKRNVVSAKLTDLTRKGYVIRVDEGRYQPAVLGEKYRERDGDARLL